MIRKKKKVMKWKIGCYNNVEQQEKPMTENLFVTIIRKNFLTRFHIYYKQYLDSWEIYYSGCSNIIATNKKKISYNSIVCVCVLLSC